MCEFSVGILKPFKIPVYVGSETSILGNERSHEDKPYHGWDGLGDSPDPEPVDESLIKDEPASTAIVRICRENEGNLTLVCLGPLTNVASAIRMDPTLGQRIQQCVIMGGNYYGKGNTTVCSEFNFFCDPEAARIVLTQLRAPVTVVGMELCYDNALSWEDYDTLRSRTSKVNEFMKRIEKQPFEKIRMNQLEWPRYIPCDEFAMAVVINESAVVRESKEVFATVEVKGEYTYGMMVVDWTKILRKPSNVKLVTEIDNEEFFKMLRQCVNWK
ncbi:nucleoside hydrolase-like isoform X2 [Ostrea edulis]|uniref:nucleoside hydrolase-like isoform X2 n=1 Tax=Ostrea edulis TaxID=37623 RepID=UPI0024AEB922|nr:nucleoside hydrolase-like isoform X2 [Ostrea edulis]